MIAGTILSHSKSMSKRLSFSSKGSVLFKNKEKRFFEIYTCIIQILVFGMMSMVTEIANVYYF